MTPPRVAETTTSEINKALIDFARLVDAEAASIRTEFASADGLITSRVVALESNLDILARSYKVGGVISYAGADSHLLQPMALSVHYLGAGSVYRRYLITEPQTTIDNTWANYPAAGAWVFVTVDYLGTLRLRAATGAGTVRPTDAVYQLTGAGSYNSIDRYGYYYADGERIIGAIHRISATAFNYIVNGEEALEDGQWTSTIGGSTTFGAQTYTRQAGWYKRDGRRSTVGYNVIISAKGAGIAGNIITPLPFAPVAPPGGPAHGFSFAPGYYVGFTQGAGRTLGIAGITGSANLNYYGSITAAAPTTLAVAALAAAAEIYAIVDFPI